MILVSYKVTFCLLGSLYNVFYTHFLSEFQHIYPSGNLENSSVKLNTPYFNIILHFFSEFPKGLILIWFESEFDWLLVSISDWCLGGIQQPQTSGRTAYSKTTVERKPRTLGNQGHISKMEVLLMVSYLCVDWFLLYVLFQVFQFLCFFKLLFYKLCTHWELIYPPLVKEWSPRQKYNFGWFY